MNTVSRMDDVVQCSNLNENEREGLKSLSERVNDGGVVCCVTDKSGRWVLESPQNYRDGCLRELADQEKTPMISAEEHNAGEKEMNGQALALLRMMGLSKDRGGDRIRNTMCATGTCLAPFYGLRKDHKSDAGDGNGPRVRPLCGAKECSTKRTSYLLCQLLTPLIPVR